jgi:transposase-like protein
MAKIVRMCPSCKSRKLSRYDTYRYKGKIKTRYQCDSCGHTTIYPLIRLIAERKKRNKK